MDTTPHLIKMDRSTNLSEVSLSSTSPPASLFNNSPTQSPLISATKTNPSSSSSSSVPPFSSVFSFINQSKQQQQQQKKERLENRPKPSSISLIDDLLFATKSISSTPSSKSSLISLSNTQDPSPSLQRKGLSTTLFTPSSSTSPSSSSSPYNDNDNDNDDDDDSDDQQQHQLFTKISAKMNKTTQSIMLQQSYHHHKNNTTEMNGLIEETTWKRIKMEKEYQQNKIRQVYKQKWDLLHDIQQTRKSLEFYESEKKTIMDMDKEKEEKDYIKLEKLERDIKTMDHQLTTLMKRLLQDLSNHPLKVAWNELLDYMKKEESCAYNVVTSCQLAKDERALQLNRYKTDMEKNHQFQLNQLDEEKSKITSARSKIDDELKRWETLEMELNQKIKDTTKDESSQKEELRNKVDELDDEIHELLIKLENLKHQKQIHLKDIEQLDHTIEQKVSTFQPEKEKLATIKMDTTSRKTLMDERLIKLDQQYTKLQEQINKQHKTHEYGLNEIKEMEETIYQATTQSQKNNKEVEFISTILNEIVIDRDHLLSQKISTQLQMKTEISDYQHHLNQQQQTCDQAHQQMEDHLSYMEQLMAKKKSLTRQKEWTLKRHANYQQVVQLDKEIQQLEVLIHQSQTNQSHYQHALDHHLEQLEEINNNLTRLYRQQNYEQQHISNASFLNLYLFIIYR
ncbi:unnamed protein product [Cunninghamella echinulata]